LRAIWDTIRRIGQIGLILLSLAFGEAGGGELLAVAAVLDESLFKRGNFRLPDPTESELSPDF
jgi:hypothetical protein